MWQPNNKIYLPGKLGDNIMQLPFALSCAGITHEDEIYPAVEFYIGKKRMRHVDDDTTQMLAELIDAQPYCKSVSVSADYDDVFWLKANNVVNTEAQRDNECIDMTRGDISWRNCLQHRCLKYWDASKPWLFLPNDDSYEAWQDTIIVSATPRYANKYVTWRCLEPIIGRCVYVGLESNRDGFYCRHHHDIKFYKAKSFVEMAQIIKHCALFIGTQSFPACLAEAMKTNRIIIQSTDIPDVIPHGGAGNAVVNEDDFAHTLNLYADAFLTDYV